MRQNYTPTLIVPQRVVLEIISEAEKHPRTETGAALIGIQAKDQIIVLATILDLENAQRLPGQFSNGGNYQSEAFDWLSASWELLRKNSRSRPDQVHWNTTTSIDPNYVPTEMDLPLSYLGDWHQQPGGMTRLSSGDLHQIRSLMKDPDFRGTQLLSPIVTRSRGKRFQFEIIGHEINTTVAPEFCVSWYYTSKETLTPIEITPFVVGDDKIPVLPKIPWFVNDPERLNNEVLYLTLLGHEVTWNVADVDKDDVLEGVFGIDNPLWRQRLVAVTKPDYPNIHAKFIVVSKPGAEIQNREPTAEQDADLPNSMNQPTVWSILKEALSLKKRSDQPATNDGQPEQIWDKEVYISDVVLKIEEERLA